MLLCILSFGFVDCLQPTEAEAMEDVLPNEPLPLELMYIFTEDTVNHLRRIVTNVAKLDKSDELMLVDDRDPSRTQRADFVRRPGCCLCMNSNTSWYYEGRVTAAPCPCCSC